jgi:hypothetical protein
VKNTQVEREDRKDDDVESNPTPEAAHSAGVKARPSAKLAAL